MEKHNISFLFASPSLPRRSVFDLSESGPPPPGSGAPGPPKQKTKTDRFLTVTYSRYMRYNMLGAPQAKILWSAPSKSRFYYLFWLLELMPGHLRRSILRILVLNPTHEISWSRSGFFSLRWTDSEGWAPGPPSVFLVFFSPAFLPTQESRAAHFPRD